MPGALSTVLSSTHHSSAQGRLGAGGPAGGDSGGQGFGPRLAGVPRRRQGAGSALLRGAASAAARRRRHPGVAHQLLLVAQNQQEQQPTLVVQAGDSGGGDDTQQGAVAAQNTMQGQQQPFKPQGLPSSRSDTMLLQSAAEGSRLGLMGGGGGGGANSLARGGGGGGAAAGATAAAAGPGQQAPAGLQGSASCVPVYVMLPLDTVNAEGVFRYASSKWFSAALQRLAATGIRGVAVDVWWGAVERRPRRYDWSGYKQLFRLVRALGLKLQVVMSFHACGGNVGDNAQIPLPQWVLQVGDTDPDIFFTDRPRDVFPGQRNRECLSFFADEEPGLLKGRSPMQCYVEFMRAFRDEFCGELGPTGLIEEVVVGCGPCGELRYPSYPEANGWRFPGVGEFQCYDRRALASLAAAARERGEPEWGNTGPHDTGSYNSSPEETGFFCSWGGNWETTYGRFFLEWYSGALLDHGERMLTAATSVFNTRRSATGQGWPTALRSARSRSLPDLPANAGMLGSGGGLPPLPADAAAAAAAAAAAVAAAGQPPAGDEGSPGGTPAAPAPAAAAGDEEGVVYGGGAFDAGLADSYRLQQQQQQQAAAAALRPSPSVDMLPPSPGAGSGIPLAPGGGGGAPTAPPPPGGGGGMGMRHHASFSSLRSSVSENEDWMGDAGSGGCSPSGPPVDLTMKVAGVHWWYRTRSHAAELTAGYFNTDQRDGYRDILELCARHSVSLTLTCVEMCDAQHPPEALCGPEGLLRQVRERAAAVGVSVAGENALPCFMPNIIDETALHRIVYNTQPWGTPLQTGAGSSGLDPAGPAAAAQAAAAAVSLGAAQAAQAAQAAAAAGSGAVAAMDTGSGGSSPVVPSPGSSTDSPTANGGGRDAAGARLPPMRAFTFLRLTDMMMTEDYQQSWGRFMRLMASNAQRFRSSAAWRRGMGFE